MATPSHVDLSVLWVPIMPETSKLGPEMEKAGKQATEDFGKGSSGLGDKIHDSFTKATSKVKDVFDKAGTDAGTSMSDSFKQNTKGIEDAAADSGKKAGKSLADNFSGAAEGPVGAIADKLGGLIGGKIGDALHNLDGPLKSVGIDIGSWQGPIQDAQGKIGDVKSTIDDFAGTLKGMPGIIGRIGGAFAELAGPISIAVGGALELSNLLDKIPGIHDHFHNPDGTPKSSIDAWVDRNIPGGRLLTHDRDPSSSPSSSSLPDLPPEMRLGGAGGDKVAEPHLGSVGGDSGYNDLLGGGAGLGDAGGFSGDLSGAIAPGGAPTAGSSGGSSGGASYNPGSIGGSVSSKADLHAQGSRVANLFAVAQSLAGTPYSQKLRNDCSGMVSRLATAALGMSPSVQFSTVNEGSWLMSHGFQPGLGGPNDLNIGWYDHGGGNAGHTAATLPGGVNAESGGSVGSFALGGPVGASSSQFEQHAHLSMDGSAGGLGVPTGAQHDPLYVMQADSSGAAGGSSETQSQGQQLGSGLVNGVLQEFGLDGSVFKSFGGSSNPLGFGITKLASGMANVFGGMLNPQQQGGGSIGGGGGSILPGLGGLIPHPSVGAVPVGPGGAQNVHTGDTTIIHGDVNSGPSVTQYGTPSPTQDMHAWANGVAARPGGMTVNGAGNLPVNGSGSGT
jgi:hypothetical protein